MRWDELTHSNRGLYQVKVQWLMAGLHWIANQTPYHDSAALHQYEHNLHVAIARYLGGNSVLDVGCGPGEQIAAFTERYGAARCVGIDYSLGMIAGLPAKMKAGFVQATALQLPFTNRSFDIVHSKAMFHHIAPDLRVQCLQEQLRVARRWVLVQDQTSLPPGLLSVLHRAYYTSIDGSYYRYTSDEWRDIVKSAGGELVEVLDAGPRVLTGRHICVVLRPA